MMNKVLHLLLALVAFLPLSVAAAPSTPPEQAYFVNDYRYEPAGPGDDLDTGHALCGNRCNALSFNYLDYLMAGSWDIRKIASGREISVSLDNPFMKGSCICTVDEYQIKVNERNRPKPK